MPPQPSTSLTAFRIADRHFPILDGGGAYRWPARWHTPGRYIIYAGLGFAVALIEQLVRTRFGQIPKNHQFAEISIPETVGVEKLAPLDLPGWNRSDRGPSQAYGDDWYDSGRTAVLVVPSLPAMGLERNVLINQRHPQFREITHAEPRPVVWDKRLFATP
jgi:RES domain-containing protein